jgi:dnd system-associated protein 4
MGDESDDPEFQSFDDSAPRDIRVPTAQREIYEELTSSTDSPFDGETRTDLFVFAMGYGYDQGLRADFSGDTHALFQRQSLSDAQEWMLKSVAVRETEDPDVLQNGKETYLIGREYANGGLNRLYELYTGPQNLFEQLTRDVIKKSDR